VWGAEGRVGPDLGDGHQPRIGPNWHELASTSNSDLSTLPPTLSPTSQDGNTIDAIVRASANLPPPQRPPGSPSLPHLGPSHAPLPTHPHLPPRHNQDRPPTNFMDHSVFIASSAWIGHVPAHRQQGLNGRSVETELGVCVGAAVGCAEVIVSDLAWFGKVFNLCAFVFLETALNLSFHAAPAYALFWLCKC
jgi:hypothetical protein